MCGVPLLAPSEVANCRVGGQCSPVKRGWFFAKQVVHVQHSRVDIHNQRNKQKLKKKKKEGRRNNKKKEGEIVPVEEHSRTPIPYPGAPP